MLSVNTNTGAMVALQYLNNTNAQLSQTQSAINSGMKVASAKRRRRHVGHRAEHARRRRQLFRRPG